ncbi:nonsense-mediated mRNA decay factor SMG8-like isoform X2 [Panonychus citri]|uniref:nonsense-mediated mRNA decay factor SMG8-like isoform X2 n=1 Tax=Panonychus citri TaxID=50023 RepID=UPI002307DE25|nr:nonsense-mediated mRNA decay factor SMG8-like isoform X2 [Panonychus citri]
MAPDFISKSSGLNGDVNCKFSLTSLDSLRDTFQFLSTNYPNFRKDKVCVISIIGKSSVGARACKSTLIDDCLGKNVFRGKFCDNKQLIDESTCHVEGYFDSRNRVIFLHLISPLDTDVIVHIANKLDHEFASKGIFQNFTDFTFKTAKILLFLFIISHIVVIVNPTPHFDLNYLQLFRLLDITRIKTSPLVSEILRDFPNISDDWVFSGRPCSPRVLFVFEAYRNSPIIANNKRIYEQHLEDQIYRFLRKSRIITNICANSLFAICNQSDFVYISTQDPTIRDSHEFLQSLMIKLCSQKQINDIDEESNGGKTFYQFLWSHISTALTKGFDDNVGRHNAVTVFELPVVEDFFLVTEKLHQLFFNLDDDPYKDSLPLLNQMRNSLDIDTRFSEGRCSKVLPIAFSIYQEGLPSHYTSDFHVRKVAQAMHFFTVQSRGPALYNYLRQLKEECDNFWNNGRQMCEVISLTGNNCINPVHRTKPEDDDHYDDLLSKTDPNYPIMPHCSGVKITSACDCGRRQANREDPFTVKSANHDFYNTFSGKCNCHHLERVEFPVFQPSTADIRPAKLNRFFDRYDDAELDSSGTEPESQPGTEQASLTDLSQAMAGEQSLEPFRRTGASGKETGQSGDKSVDPMRIGDLKETVKGQESPCPETPKKLLTTNDEKTKSNSIKSGGSAVDDYDDVDNCKNNSQLTKSDTLNHNVANGGVAEANDNNNTGDDEEDDGEEDDDDDDDEIGEGVDKSRDIQLIIREYNRSPHSSIFNQHSTIEYLPGMLHSQSPPGLLPKFSSWSLVCLGSSSLYSHNMGVQDQPGFISGTNFLLPWDVTVKLEHSGQLPPLWEGKRPPGIKNKKTLKDGTQFTVKIFIGVEYECPRGHRFMSSKPASVLKATKGIVKENANLIASNDMPVFIPCVCSRSGKLLYGQLMRLHVVTPKAPVHVTLNPRVQPAPNPCPIFSPGNLEPVKLSQSAYWILRLPFVYQGDHGVYMPYKDRLDSCRLLKDTYGISDYVSKPKK